MPSIEIDYALTDSQIPASDFSAVGTWVNDTTPGITCVLRPSSGSDIEGDVDVQANGFWAATFNTLTVGATFTLRAEFVGGQPSDVEPNIRVGSNSDPSVEIKDVIDEALVEATTSRKYTVSGTYSKGTTGQGGVCLAVRRTGNTKKIQSVLAAEHIKMQANQGNWSVEFVLDLVAAPQGQKVTFIALMINADGQTVARSGRKSKKRP